MRKIISSWLILSVFLLGGLGLVGPAEAGDPKYTYSRVLDDGLVAEWLAIDGAGLFFLKQRSRDANTGRVFYGKNSGKLSADEFQILQSSFQDLEASEFEDTYNDCGQDTPYSEITFFISGSKSVVTAYELAGEEFKNCKSPKPPESVAKILQQLKMLYDKYSPPS